MSTTSAWDARLDDVLHGVLPLLPELADDTCLRNHGLDSLATIEVLIQLEDAYGVSIPDTLLTADTFATPASLWRVLVEVGASAEPVGAR
jgi:acyl carrier protein